MGAFVAVEGLPGCGKTTATQALAEILRSEGYRVQIVGLDTTEKQRIYRKIAGECSPEDPRRTLLYWLVRLEQQDETQRLIDESNLVIADRYWGSTIAMDAFGKQVPEHVCAWVEGYSIQADLTIFLDAPVATIRARKGARTMQNDAFASRVEAGYRNLAQARGWLRIDASQPIEQVIEDLRSSIDSLLS